jgi:hypothetical protein
MSFQNSFCFQFKISNIFAYCLKHLLSFYIHFIIIYSLLTQNICMSSLIHNIIFLVEKGGLREGLYASIKCSDFSRTPHHPANKICWCIKKSFTFIKALISLKTMLISLSRDPSILTNSHCQNNNTIIYMNIILMKIYFIVTMSCCNMCKTIKCSFMHIIWISK